MDDGTAFVAVVVATAPVGVAVAAPARLRVESEFRVSRLRSTPLLEPQRANLELLFLSLYTTAFFRVTIPAILCNSHESSPQAMLSSGSRGISFWYSFQEVVGRICSIFRFLAFAAALRSDSSSRALRQRSFNGGIRIIIHVHTGAFIFVFNEPVVRIRNVNLSLVRVRRKLASCQRFLLLRFSFFHQRFAFTLMLEFDFVWIIGIRQVCLEIRLLHFLLFSFSL